MAIKPKQVERFPLTKIEIRLTPDQALALQHLAAWEGKSVAELIRLNVDAMLRANSIFHLEARRQKAIAAWGKLHSGSEDLSVEHDRYLVHGHEESHAG